MSSVREFQIAIDCIKEFNKPYLIGAHISEGTKLPSGENISEITTKIKHKNYIFLSGIDFIHEFFNLDRRIKILEKSDLYKHKQELKILEQK